MARNLSRFPAAISERDAQGGGLTPNIDPYVAMANALAAVIVKERLGIQRTNSYLNRQKPLNAVAAAGASFADVATATAPSAARESNLAEASDLVPIDLRIPERRPAV